MTLLCEHSHDRRAGLSGKALASSLESARRLCAARGERLTRPRERVLELLLQASGPLKAYDLLAGMSVADGRAAPPTVYRALDFLASQGLAHRIESLGAFVACCHPGGHNAAFLICDCCGAAREFDPGEARLVAEEARRDGFVLSGVMLEAHGLCAECQGARA